MYKSESLFAQVKYTLLQPTIMFGMAMIVMLWFGIVFQIYSEHEGARRSANQDLNNFARVFEEHVVRSVRELDKALLIARKRYLDARNKGSYLNAIGQRLPDPQLLSDMSFQLAMIDRDGLLRATTIGKHPPKLIDLKDRGHFQIHKKPRADTPYISIPVLGRRSGRWSVQLTRKVPGPKGTFDGVIVASINPKHFARFYGSIDLGEGGVVVLGGNDGVVRATSGSKRLSLGAQISKNDLLKSAQLGNGVYTGDVDGSSTQRIFATRKIPGHPLFVAVAIPESQVYQTVDQNSARYQMVGIAITLVIMVVMFAAILRQRHLDNARIELAISEKKSRRKSRELELTLENMGQGILMVGADNSVAVANARALELLDLSDQLLSEIRDFSNIFEYTKKMGEVETRPVKNCAVSTAGDKAPARIYSHYELKRHDGVILEINNQELPEGGFVQTITDITSRRTAELKIFHLAHHDTLTNLANRTLFKQRLYEAIAGLKENGVFGVFFLDLDNFKMINDTYGHIFGDKLLQCVSKRLQAAMKEFDTIARFGGDEFAIILKENYSREKIENLAEYLLDTLREPFEIDARTISITASIGSSIAPVDAEDPEELLQNADIALYRAKMDGRNLYRPFTPEMKFELLRKQKMELELKSALSREQFELHYQPLVDLARKRITGFEALVRWRHPENGLVSPMDFIPIAEDTRQIIPIGEWVLREACKQAVTLGSEFTMAVNLSPVQFSDENLIELIKNVLDETELSPERLELEITENILMKSTGITVAKLQEIKELGIQISIDDFGTGYSSLGYLRKFPIDKIKIDRCFIKDMGYSRESEAIIRSVLGLAETLDLKTTAEGVEEEAQLEMLEKMNCTQVQGYLYSPPVPRGELKDIIEKINNGSVIELVQSKA